MSIEQHLASITLAGQRPDSVATRKRVLNCFAKHLLPKSLDEATRANVELFLARPLKPRSRKAYLAHLRGYYRWALDLGLVTDDPTAKLKGVKVPPGVPRPVPSNDLSLAVEAADARMRAWLLLMSLGGLRCCEVARLRPQDVLEMECRPMLFLREMKGGGSGTVPAHPAVITALAVLPQKDGAWWTVGPQQISSSVARHLRGLGIDATAHQLRHYAGTAWYRASDHDLLATARLLRHRNVATTQVYAELDPARPAEVVNLVPLPSVATSTRGEVA